jgi:tripartite-type tricarboxylate transporter receptor subunit TctC
VKIRKMSCLHALTMIALALAVSGVKVVLAQSYPAKPVRIVIGQPPGGAQDILVRGVSQGLAKIWGQSVIVDNRPSTGDIIAATSAAKSAPDGHTIFFTSSTNMSAAQFLRRDLPYDPVKDFVPVVGVGQIHNVLFMSNKVPASNLRELIALARAKPGALNYGSFGVGSAPHIDTEAFAKAAGVRFTHVPYKGAAGALNALVAGEIDLVLGGPGAPMVRQGRLRAIADGGRERSRTLLEVPTFAEVGYDFESVGMFSMYVPAGTPRSTMDKIAADTSQVRAAPAFQEKILFANGMDELPLRGEELAARLQRSREIFAERIKGLDIKLE